MHVFQQPRQITIQQTQNPVVAIKSEPSVLVEPVNQPYILPEQIQIPVVKQEPNIAVVTTAPATINTQQQPQDTQQTTKLSEHGISIDTPSSIIPSLNFDTFTSTGLTPTATPVSGFSFPVTSSSTPGTLNTPMTNTASSSISSRCVTQQRLS